MDLSTNVQGRNLLDLCISNRLRILNGRHNGDRQGKYTRYTSRGCSVVDYVIVSADMQCRITNFCVATLKTYSDHCPLEFAFTVTFANPSIEDQTVWTDSEDMNNMPSNLIVNISGLLKWGKTKFINSLKDKNVVEKAVTLQRSLTSEPPNIGATKLTAFLTELAKDSNGANGTEKCNKNHKRRTTNGFPNNHWFDAECKAQKRKVNDAKNNLYLNPRDEDKRKAIKKKKQETMYKLHTRLLSTCKENPKQFWKLIPKAKVQHQQNSTIDPKQFLSHFPKLNEADKLTTPQATDSTSTLGNYVAELDDEIVRAVKTMKLNRAPGIDGLTLEVYKELDPLFISILRTLFNHILRTRQYPSIWSIGMIVPIHKGGTKDDPSNYRGITLLNTVGKIFTSIVNSRLTEWVEKQQLIPESQFGFRKNRRTTDCIFIMNTLIETSRAHKVPLYVCFVDFRKVFDSVDHTMLWTKLIKLGISEQLLEMLQSMYSTATSSVKLSTYEVTHQFPCKKGIRQGCNLSPLLFSLFISDLEK